MVENLIREYKRAYSIRIMFEEKLQEMTYLSGCSYHVQKSSGGRSDPTAARTMSREELENRIAAAKKDEAEAKQAMEQALQTLDNGNLRKIAIYHFYNGWGWAEIARRLGMKVSTVKMQWKRFREKEKIAVTAVAGGQV